MFLRFHFRKNDITSGTKPTALFQTRKSNCELMTFSTGICDEKRLSGVTFSVSAR